MKANVITIAFKVMYDTPHGAKGEVASVNSKANMVPVGCYMGDDCLKKMQQYMSHLPSMLEKMQNEDLNIDDTVVHVKLYLGGDLKFFTGLLGMAGN